MAEIVQKADGVFLWVFLMVRSLLDCFRNEDSLSTLKRRLRSLPSDLEAYFQHMLDGIEGVYRQQAAKTFQFTLHARELLTLLTFSMLDEESPELAITCSTTPMGFKELVTRLRVMETRLNARCRDLLEAEKQERRVYHFSEAHLLTLPSARLLPTTSSPFESIPSIALFAISSPFSRHKLSSIHVSQKILT